MLQRVMPDLMRVKNILVLNDEAHHCYREKPGAAQGDEEDLKGDDKKEAERNNEAARLSPSVAANSPLPSGGIGWQPTCWPNSNSTIGSGNLC